MRKLEKLVGKRVKCITPRTSLVELYKRRAYHDHVIDQLKNYSKALPQMKDHLQEAGYRFQ